MKTISFFCSILIVVLMTGCLEPDCCAPPSSNLFFVNLRNSEGSNLLDPQTTGAVDLSKTRLYLIENGASKMFKFEDKISTQFLWLAFCQVRFLLIYGK